MESHDADFRESGEGWAQNTAPTKTANTNSTTLAARLAQTAAGTWGEEAAVWLLTEHGHWLPELERVGLIYDDEISDTLTYKRILWDLDGSEADRMLGTPSERPILYLAHAIATGADETLRNLTSLDETDRRRVLHAIAWAAGGRDWADTLQLLPNWPDRRCGCSARFDRHAEGCPEKACRCPDDADWHQVGCPQFNG